MDQPLVNITEDQVTTFFRALLVIFKKLMAWLGILVLPDEDEKKDYPNYEEETAELVE